MQFIYVEDFKTIKFEKILQLYREVEWQRHVEDPQGLEKAFANSAYVCLCVTDDRVIGLIRSISDGVTIHYIQDLLVSPEFHRQGVGRALVERALKFFEKINVTVLMTDDEEKQKQFYQSLNFKNIKTFKKRPLNCYTLRKDLDFFFDKSCP